MSPEEIIKAAYKSKNIMTPTVLSYGKITDRIAYELSEGEGINRETLYGVTVAIMSHDGESAEDMKENSQVFASRVEADTHIKLLRIKYKNRQLV
jgi:hypothetical protein